MGENSKSPHTSSLQSTLDEAIAFMPESRKLTKRGQAITLDALLDDFRSQARLAGGALDFLLMGYRYGHLFLREKNAFREDALKPAELVDLWQLAFGALLSRDRIPTAVMVSETVELAKKKWGAHTSGITNAFLRGVVRKLDELKAELDREPEALLGPEILVRWGENKELCRKMAEQLRVRPESGFTVFDAEARFGRVAFEEMQSGRQLQAMNEGSWAFMSWMVDAVAKAREASAAAQARGPVFRYLDACAAPGGKLLAASALFAARGLKPELVATEAKFPRFQRLEENLSRWEYKGGERPKAFLHAWGESTPEEAALVAPFDVILADLPCSGTGTLATRPDILFEPLGQRVRELRKLQQAIVKDLRARLSPGGLLFVSVCSVDHEEIENLNRACGAAPIFSSLKAAEGQKSSYVEGITGWQITGAPLN